MLEQAGQPVVRITLGDRYGVGQEFFRWEMATAVAGSILELNPFDQPDVEASKIETRKITDACEAGSSLPDEVPLATDGQLQLFADERNATELRALAAEQTVAALLAAHFNRANAGDYVALLAYLERNAANTDSLQRVRGVVGQQGKIASCLGFGPRFLHSTGQAYKGGPNTGVFLQITADASEDLAVPGEAIPLAWSRLRRRWEILRCWLSGVAGCCGCISLARCRLVLSGSMDCCKSDVTIHHILRTDGYAALYPSYKDLRFL